MDRPDWSRSLIQIYLLGIPLWWGLGADFIVPQFLAVALAFVALPAHRRLTLPDYTVFCIILALATAGYVNGFLRSHQFIRFLAALYNLSFWVCGLIIVQQVRNVLNEEDGRRLLLRTCFWAFVSLLVVAWGSFILAYVIGQFLLVVPSAFGLTLGGHLPPGAVIVQQSTQLVFTQPDWGLPGVPIPRVQIYGPYPTATAASTAVLGTLALLYLQSSRVRAWAILAFECLIVLTLALTLTRSILGGWLVGSLLANLIFGSAWRRIAACGAVLAAMLVAVQIDISKVTEYRAYSSESRFENYLRAFDRTLAVHPVLGLGIKPRQEGIHIAVGSHSTIVSTFTKGGTLSLCFVLAYLYFIPALRWLFAFGVLRPDEDEQRWRRRPKPELRALFNLQVAIWVWLCFEDIDAPATASTLIFLAFAFIECVYRTATFGSGVPLKSPSFYPMIEHSATSRR